MQTLATTLYHFTDMRDPIKPKSTLLVGEGANTGPIAQDSPPNENKPLICRWQRRTGDWRLATGGPMVVRRSEGSDSVILRGTRSAWPARFIDRRGARQPLARSLGDTGKGCWRNRAHDNDCSDCCDAAFRSV